MGMSVCYLIRLFPGHSLSGDNPPDDTDSHVVEQQVDFGLVSALVALLPDFVGKILDTQTLRFNDVLCA